MEFYFPNSNSTQYERNRWIASLVFAVGWTASAAKLTCVGLRLNASKSESVLEGKMCCSFIWACSFHTLISWTWNTRAFVWVKPVGCVSNWSANMLAFCGRLEEKKQSRKEQKSLVDDLDAEAGTVRSRVALLLRSAEVYPVFSWFILLLVYCTCTRNSGNAGKGTRAIILTPLPQFSFPDYLAFVLCLRVFAFKSRLAASRETSWTMLDGKEVWTVSLFVHVVWVLLFFLQVSTDSGIRKEGGTRDAKREWERCWKIEERNTRGWIES